MSDALPLPPRPSLEQYKKLAKDFQHACDSIDSCAIRACAAHWAEKIARLQGLEITPAFRRQIDVKAEQMELRWRKSKKPDESATPCTLTDAQFFIARGHGFASWPKFVQHLESLTRADSPVSQFEAAVDATVSGDSEMLAKLLSENTELVRERSTREHRSTLLHYVSANGVEDFRQTTPKNIVEITKLLLNAGANVNAESDAYGGGWTTLGLTATSWHPEKAGVQIPLMELLIDRGAFIDAPGSAVNACLHNGRAQAAEFLASRGAQLDLEGAAGVGRLDVVKGFFNDDGTLKPTATPKQMQDAFSWACQFGRTHVVEFLLDQGMDAGAPGLRHHGQTGLHWAAFRGQVETVKLLLDWHAPVDAKDETFGTTPLSWALYAWSNEPDAAPPSLYCEVAALLIAAGAAVQPDWLVDENIGADPKMFAALTGAPREA